MHQNSEYVKVLNMARFSICEHYTHSEYTRISLDRVLNLSRVLNMSGFWIWQCSENIMVKKGSKYAVCHSMVQYV